MDNLKLIVDNINQKKFDLALRQCENYDVKENKYLINNFIGVIYSLKNNKELAEDYFKKSHELNEKFEDPLKNLYIINIQKKNYSEAINIAQKLINLNNKNDLFFYQLAYAFELNNDKLLAIENYEKCKDLSGKNKLKALNNIGNIYLKNNKPKISLKYFLEANEIEKNDKIINNNILQNYIKLKNENKSDEYFEISKKLDSKYIEFIYNEAQYYIFKGKFNEAIKLLNNHKDKPKFLIVLIELCFNMGNFKEGELLLNGIRNEIKKDINLFNYIGIRSLREGNFEDGWKFYENRGSKTTSYLNNIKEWNGESLESKRIVVFCEQGIGDALQFSKYVYSLTKTAKDVVFIVSNSIKNLFRSDLKNLTIETRDSFIDNGFEYKISLGSLIKFFYLEKFSSHDHLINKNIDTNKDWKNKLRSNKPNVGLVWTGSFLGPNQPFRSIQLKNLVKILELDINFYCLQNEIWQSDKEYFNTDKIKDFGKYDLVEISSIIKNLDLVISVDTAILHISAILNKETWGIFNIYPDWRWGALDKINPYNSLIKINQTKFNQWEDVTNQIYNKLKKKFKLN